MTDDRRPSVIPGEEIPTQTIEITGLFADGLTTTGSFDVRSDIWKTAFGKLLKALPVPALLVDPNHRIISANQAWKRFGCDYEKLGGTPVSVLFPDRSSARQVRSILQEVFSTRRPHTAEANLEIEKSRVFGRMTFRSIRIEKERLVLVLFEDLTAERRLLQETKRNRRDLEKRVRDRTAELSETNERLNREIRDRMEAQDALYRSREQLRLITDSLPAAIAHIDDQCRYLFVNKTYGKWTNAAHDLMPGVHVSEMVGEELYEKIKGYLAAALSGQEVTFELKARFRDGQYRHVICTYVPETAASGNVTGLIALITDISDLKRAEAETLRAKEEWERTFDTVPELIMILDRDMRVVRMNKPMADRLRYTASEAVGRFCHELCHGTDYPPGHCPVLRSFAGKTEFSAEIVEDLLGGAFLVSVTPLRDSADELTGFVHVARDITEQKRLEKDLRRMATTDSLTGLFNRGHFWDMCERELARGVRAHRTVGILMIDLDHFKSVNDTYGHEVGDTTLKLTAQAARENLREIDIIGRIGGEEFAVLLPETGLSEALAVAERLREAVARAQVPTAKGPVSITISIGAAEDNGELRDLGTLLKRADDALYDAKRKGRNRVEPYTRDP
ncbi:MAG: diguanylate cyclase [Pseudomonadota bacterium]